LLTIYHFPGDGEICKEALFFRSNVMGATAAGTTALPFGVSTFWGQALCLTPCLTPSYVFSQSGFIFFLCEGLIVVLSYNRMYKKPAPPTAHIKLPT